MLDTLVDRHYDALIGYLYRLLYGDRALAEDMAQETFLRVLRGIKQYSYPRPFKAWLYAIATNLARDHYSRADTRRVSALPETGELNPAFAVDGGDDAIIAQDEQQAVIAARPFILSPRAMPTESGMPPPTIALPP